MTPKAFVKIQRRLERVISDASNAIETARDQVVIPPIEKLRPATADDIKEGAVIFHRQLLNDYVGWYWHIISEVRYPNDDFKAYVAEDGCRYGLNEAFVEKKGGAK